MANTDTLRSQVILLVDDDPAVRGAISSVLENVGYTLLEAANGFAALEILAQADHVDLVITDMVMDVLSGEETIQKLRVVNAGLPIIAMSGAFRDDPGAAAALGIQATLAKPFRWQELLSTVERVLQPR